jgi:hypothetical protein
MFRTPLNLSYLKRTIRPIYAFTQATPKAAFVDPAWDKSVDIYPGMALMKTSGDNVTLINGTGTPYGLSAFFMAPVLGIDEISDQGVNAAAVWVLSQDAEFEVLAPAFDTTVSWTDPGDGTFVLVGAYTSGAKRGQLCPMGTAGAAAYPVARLLQVVSSTKIRVGGLRGANA